MHEKHGKEDGNERKTYELSPALPVRKYREFYRVNGGVVVTKEDIQRLLASYVLWLKYVDGWEMLDVAEVVDECEVLAIWAIRLRAQLQVLELALDGRLLVRPHENDEEDSEYGSYAPCPEFVAVCDGERHDKFDAVREFLCLEHDPVLNLVWEKVKILFASAEIKESDLWDDLPAEDSE